jgi:4-nitrophenyl phosphatase
MAVQLKGLSADIHAMLFDMDGVIWKSETPTGDLKTLFAKLNALNIKYGFITNNGTKSIESVLNRLDNFGVPADENNFLNSAIATLSLLKERFPEGGNVYIVGEDGLITTLEEAGYIHQENPGDDTVAVVAGLDHGVNYEKLAHASRLIRNGAPFYASNGDKTFPTPKGPVPGAGTILAAITAASGVEPIVAGKPQPLLFELMLKRMEVAPENALVIGDRLETDIAGGINAGCPTLLVLSGISTMEDIDVLNIHPDIIRNDIFELLTEI